MFKKIKNLFKKYVVQSKKGSEIVAIALILLFIILAAAPKIKTLGDTTSKGVGSLNTQLEDTLKE